MENNERMTLSEEELRLLQGGLRELLREQLMTLDPSIMAELTLEVKPMTDKFHNWNDRFDNDGRFSDAFGKSGGKTAEVKARVGPSTEVT